MQGEGIPNGPREGGSPIEHRARKWATVAFVGAVVVQALHMSEHFIQLHQWVMYVPNPRGLVGALFNFVWVHFAFNTALFVTIAISYYWWLQARTVWRTSRVGTMAFHALVAVQGYHTIEHVIQMWQYYVVQMPKPTGIIGEVIPNVLAHFDLNGVVLVLQVAVLVALRPTAAPAPPSAGPSHRTGSAVPGGR